MLPGIILPVRFLVRALTAERQPKQIALGISLGLLVGLVPKGNLTAVILGIVLVATRVNLGIGLLTAFVVSSVSAWLDPLTHGIGLRVLATQSFNGFLGEYHNKPLVPWLALNNTVVLGSMLLGLALFYPVYVLSEPFVVWIGPRLRIKIGRRQSSTAEATAASQAGVSGEGLD